MWIFKRLVLFLWFDKMWSLSKYFIKLLRLEPLTPYAYLVKEFLALFNESSPLSAASTPVNRVSIGSDNGLSPIRRQAII